VQQEIAMSPPERRVPPFAPGVSDIFGRA